MQGYTSRRMRAGPIDHLGDRHVADEELSATVARILRDGRTDLPDVDMHVVRRVRVGSRTLDVTIRRHPDDLSSPGIAQAASEAIIDHAMRYGWDRSTYETDLVERSFDVVVEIDPAYWGARQRSIAHLDDGEMTPTAFMRAITPGDVLHETAGPMAGRAYRVTSSSDGRFVTDDGLGGRARMSWPRPKAECLHVSGDRVRIATGSIRDPDSYSMLRWIRTR